MVRNQVGKNFHKTVFGKKFSKKFIGRVSTVMTDALIEIHAAVPFTRNISILKF